jgi:hypothetical protein
VEPVKKQKLEENRPKDVPKGKNYVNNVDQNKTHCNIVVLSVVRGMD